MKELDALKKKALMMVALNMDTKTQVTSAAILKLTQELKRISVRKSVTVIVVESDD